ncbi:hypothetical protein ACFL0Z_01390 [Patescibacteria group bacterium]
MNDQQITVLLQRYCYCVNKFRSLKTSYFLTVGTAAFFLAVILLGLGLDNGSYVMAITLGSGIGGVVLGCKQCVFLWRLLSSERRLMAIFYQPGVDTSALGQSVYDIRKTSAGRFSPGVCLMFVLFQAILWVLFGAASFQARPGGVVNMLVFLFLSSLIGWFVDRDPDRRFSDF